MEGLGSVSSTRVIRVWLAMTASVLGWGPGPAFHSLRDPGPGGCAQGPTSLLWGVTHLWLCS